LNDSAVDDPWLTRTQVASRLQLPPKTLAVWASQGKGPRYAVFGKHARYRLSDVMTWETAQFDGHDAA
jgi:hypothetical protein